VRRRCVRQRGLGVRKEGRAAGTVSARSHSRRQPGALADRQRCRVDLPRAVRERRRRKPADLGSLEIYAITATRKPETPEERKVATLIGTLPVRPILPPPPPDATPEILEAIEKALPPGLDQGARPFFTKR
jgi:hypothetical protein